MDRYEIGKRLRQDVLDFMRERSPKWVTTMEISDRMEGLVAWSPIRLIRIRQANSQLGKLYIEGKVERAPKAGRTPNRWRLRT